MLVTESLGHPQLAGIMRKESTFQPQGLEQCWRPVGGGSGGQVSLPREASMVTAKLNSSRNELTLGVGARERGRLQLGLAVGSSVWC